MGLLDTLEKDYKAEEEFSVELPVASLPTGKMTLWFRGFKDVNERQAAAKKASGYSKAALVLGKARELGITGDNDAISEQLAAVHLIHATFLRSDPEEEFSLQDAMRLLRLGEAFVLLKFQWEQGQKTVQSVMTQYFIDEAKKKLSDSRRFLLCGLRDAGSPAEMVLKHFKDFEEYVFCLAALAEVEFDEKVALAGINLGAKI